MLGSSRYFNGSGTPPATGAAGNLRVTSTAGGSATFTFQVDVGCHLGPLVNLVDVVSGADSASAAAVTNIVPGGADADGDGVADLCADVCPGTVIPEGVPTQGLKKNRYALVNGDTIFDTVGSGELFTTTDTGGCSCEQIIAALHLGSGETKNGCSVGNMRRWIDLVNP